MRAIREYIQFLENMLIFARVFQTRSIDTKKLEAELEYYRKALREEAENV